ncbi:hypothetical protein TNIN_417551 [Trichonephila inaurata madagascariensis]|uniref:Transmembrane protein n=1 Tax=Trichonephila inaurata madagascariensis TaxID=2747483 RepID=A0A8X6Y4L9_9ARAC|nr:hypothetical protein TNIN_417551 [Trichonephila inaurata madagascariensis]
MNPLCLFHCSVSIVASFCVTYLAFVSVGIVGSFSIIKCPGLQFLPIMMAVIGFLGFCGDDFKDCYNHPS